MVEHQLSDDAQAPAMRLAQEALEILQRSISWVYISVVGDVVAVVPPR
jgi:hypothetical protein